MWCETTIKKEIRVGRRPPQEFERDLIFFIGNLNSKPTGIGGIKVIGRERRQREIAPDANRYREKKDCR